MAAEKTFENKIKAYLTAHGAWFIKTWAGANTSMGKGTPDILVCWYGKFLSIEVKRPDGKGHIAPVQKKQANLITQAGGTATFISQIDTLYLVEAYLKDDPELLTKFSPAERKLLKHCGSEQIREIYSPENIEGVW